MIDGKVHLTSVTPAEVTGSSDGAMAADLVAIRALKLTYMTCLNDKNWPGLRETLSVDASVAYENGESQYTGLDAIMEYLRTSIGHLEVMHVASNGRIELRGRDRAVGQWDLRFQWYDPWDNTYLRGGGVYFDEYFRTVEGWRISFTGFELSE